MPHLRRVIACASVALAATAICAAPAAAQSVAEFYKGKTVAILMGTQPGGSYDLYGRVICEHLSRYIPGNPTIIMEHMPGAGGVVAGNHLYGPGPQDGTKILLSHSIPLAERLEPKGVRFESSKFQWLGTFDAIAHTMAIWHRAQVNTIDVLKTKPLVIGSFSKSHLTYQWAAMMKACFDRLYLEGARRELQGHHRLPQRQRLQPGDGARRDPGLGRLLGESGRHAAAVADREESCAAGIVHI